jgi:hypothetical protein
MQHEGVAFMSHGGTPLQPKEVADRRRPDSINNRYGAYGSSGSSTSVRNASSAFGSASSILSANNPTASWPPAVFKGGKRIAFLTTNQTFLDRVSLAALDSCTFTAAARLEF